MEIKRNMGIELGRIIAAFGVVMMHAGIINVNLTKSSLFIQHFMNFAVPFFICTSMYFAAGSKVSLPWKMWLSKNFNRILLPYLAWSVVYFFLTLVKNKTESALLLEKIYTGLFLTGGGSIALYFVPLLFVGLFVCKLFHRLKELNIHSLVFLMVFSYILIYISYLNGEIYNLGTTHAFTNIVPIQSNAFLHVLLAYCSHALFCLPHIFVAYVLTKVACDSKILYLGVFLFFIPVFLDLPGDFSMHLRGDGFLMLCLFINKYIKINYQVEKIAACMFGLYLLHQIPYQAAKILGSKLNILPEQTDVYLLAAISVIIFVTSFLLVKSIAGTRLSRFVGF